LSAIITVVVDASIDFYLPEYQNSAIESI